MATCKQCGKSFVFDGNAGYAADLCGPFCDGVHSQRAKLSTKDAEIERLQRLWQTAVDNEGTQWAEDIEAAAAEGGGDE